MGRVPRACRAGSAASVAGQSGGRDLERARRAAWTEIADQAGGHERRRRRAPAPPDASPAASIGSARGRDGRRAARGHARPGFGSRGAFPARVRRRASGGRRGWPAARGVGSRGRREGLRRQLADDGARLDAAVLVLVARAVELQRPHVPRRARHERRAVARPAAGRVPVPSTGRDGRPTPGGRPTRSSGTGRGCRRCCCR